MAKQPPARLTLAEGRNFAFTVGGAFLVIAGVIWWRRGPGFGALAPAALGAALLLAGLFVPSHLTPVHRAWMGLAVLISKVTTPILLAVIYFVVIAPIGLVRRTIGRDPLDHRPDEENGYWQPAEPPGSDLERQF